jgi:hypothetical protein
LISKEGLEWTFVRFHDDDDDDDDDGGESHKNNNNYKSKYNRNDDDKNKDDVLSSPVGHEGPSTEMGVMQRPGQMATTTILFICAACPVSN